jgi:hypothetical protein
MVYFESFGQKETWRFSQNNGRKENSKQKLKGHDQTQSDISIKYMMYANILNRSQYNSKV